MWCILADIGYLGYKAAVLGKDDKEDTVLFSVDTCCLKAWPMVA